MKKSLLTVLTSLLLAASIVILGCENDSSDSGGGGGSGSTVYNGSVVLNGPYVTAAQLDAAFEDGQTDARVTNPNNVILSESVVSVYGEVPLGKTLEVKGVNLKIAAGQILTLAGTLDLAPGSIVAADNTDVGKVSFGTAAKVTGPDTESGQEGAYLIVSADEALRADKVPTAFVEGGYFGVGGSGLSGDTIKGDTTGIYAKAKAFRNVRNIKADSFTGAVTLTGDQNTLDAGIAAGADSALSIKVVDGSALGIPEDIKELTGTYNIAGTLVIQGSEVTLGTRVSLSKGAIDLSTVGGSVYVPAGSVSIKSVVGDQLPITISTKIDDSHPAIAYDDVLKIGAGGKGGVSGAPVTVAQGLEVTSGVTVSGEGAELISPGATFEEGVYSGDLTVSTAGAVKITSTTFALSDGAVISVANFGTARTTVNTLIKVSGGQVSVTGEEGVTIADDQAPKFGTYIVVTKGGLTSESPGTVAFNAGVKVKGDASFKGKVIAEGIATFQGKSTFEAETEFHKAATFVGAASFTGSAVFSEDAVFGAKPYFEVAPVFGGNTISGEAMDLVNGMVIGPDSTFTISYGQEVSLGANDKITVNGALVVKGVIRYDGTGSWFDFVSRASEGKLVVSLDTAELGDSWDDTADAFKASMKLAGVLQKQENSGEEGDAAYMFGVGPADSVTTTRDFVLNGPNSETKIKAGSVEGQYVNGVWTTTIHGNVTAQGASEGQLFSSKGNIVVASDGVLLAPTELNLGSVAQGPKTLTVYGTLVSKQAVAWADFIDDSESNVNSTITIVYPGRVVQDSTVAALAGSSAIDAATFHKDTKGFGVGYIGEKNNAGEQLVYSDWMLGPGASFTIKPSDNADGTVGKPYSITLEGQVEAGKVTGSTAYANTAAAAGALSTEANGATWLNTDNYKSVKVNGTLTIPEGGKLVYNKGSSATDNTNTKWGWLDKASAGTVIVRGTVAQTDKNVAADINADIGWGVWEEKTQVSNTDLAVNGEYTLLQTSGEVGDDGYVPHGWLEVTTAEFDAASGARGYEVVAHGGLTIGGAVDGTKPLHLKSENLTIAEDAVVEADNTEAGGRGAVAVYPGRTLTINGKVTIVDAESFANFAECNPTDGSTLEWGSGKVIVNYNGSLAQKGVSTDASAKWGIITDTANHAQARTSTADYVLTKEGDSIAFNWVRNAAGNGVDAAITISGNGVYVGNAGSGEGTFLPEKRQLFVANNATLSIPANQFYTVASTIDLTAGGKITLLSNESTTERNKIVLTTDKGKIVLNKTSGNPVTVAAQTLSGANLTGIGNTAGTISNISSNGAEITILGDVGNAGTLSPTTQAVSDS